MDQETWRDFEAFKAQTRINFYLTGGSRPVYVSRWVVSAIVAVFWLAVWLSGIG